MAELIVADDPIKTPDGFLVVAIGASAGGIKALREFFNNVAPDSGAAYVVILHLSPDHDSQLVSILTAYSPLPVTQVKEDVLLEPNHIYVISPNKHLLLQDGHIKSSVNIYLEERRAPVDIFFRNLAEHFGARAICVILSGTGANGSMGLKRVKEKGGAVFIQNPMEAEFNEMPRNAIATDLVDEILPASQIPAKIVSYRNGIGSVQISVNTERRPEDQQQALREIFTQLRLRTGHDFSNYKRPTLLRRIERRINIRNLYSLPEYAAYIRQNPEETTALMKDLLISVTNFFRDEASWNMIMEEVLPRVLKDKGAGDHLRIWVAGCATGEEAYSIAMMCIEKTIGIIDSPMIQIFATDIDEAAIAIARDGYYSINDAADVSPERLRRFFNREGDGYRIRREVRELILFAHHNFIKDPPFSHLDLISCRNVLIYLNSFAQERVAETFHFALNPGSYLFLGSSESVDSASDLYTIFNREHHIFQSRPVNNRFYPVPESTPRYTTDQLKMVGMTAPERRQNERISYGELHQQLLEQYAPPSIVVNAEYDMVHISERAGRYLQVSGGEPSSNLLKMILPELRIELRSALYQATEHQSPVEARGLAVNIDGKKEAVTIHVRPVFRKDDPAYGFILVLFEQAYAAIQKEEVVQATDESAARHLEEELIRMKSQLRNTIEQYEFRGEELKASNEELQAMNEELRSAAEELETSKEELQSINEEMRTVNQELKIKIEETTVSSNNLQNLIYSANIGTIFLDRAFRVALFTPAVREVFNLIPSDHGRPITDITNTLQYPDLLKDAEAVLGKLVEVEKEVNTTNGKVYMMRLLPYRTSEDRINGVVITFFDVTSRKKAQDAVLANEERFRILTNSVPQLVWANDFNGIANYFNTRWYEYTGLSFNASEGKGWEAIVHPEDEERAKKAWAKAQMSGEVFEIEYRLKDGNGNYRWFIGRNMPVTDGAKKVFGWVGSATDIDTQKAVEAALQAISTRLQLALESGNLGCYEYEYATGNFIVTEQFKDMFGIDPGMEITYDDVIQTIVADERAMVTEAWAKAKEERITFDIEYRILTPGEIMKWIHSAGKVIYNQHGEAERLVAITTDITREKLFTEELSKLVDKRTVELKQSNDDLLQFAHVASHDLKEPVRKIKTFSNLLVKKFAPAMPADAAEHVHKINTATDRLLEMIEGILTYSKAGGMEEELEYTNLNKVVDNVKIDLELAIKEKEATLTVAELPAITASRTLIHQLFYNIINNALKFAREEEHMRIDISGETVMMDGRDYAKILIADNGIGIDNEYAESIFNAFFRINAKDKYEGTGLGLALCKKIVDRHKGFINAEGRMGEGTVFTIFLPLSP